ncbi:MAG: TIR domain-containing protein [Ruminococcaceae bacterium]|nr:TIR domain-containing protein [Oscillospiraceae bacterium]
MERNEELLRIIADSTEFSEVRSTGLLPEPDADDGYYFISYSHKDYKKVTPDILRLREAGAKIWYDRGLESGKSWIKEVKKKISSYYCKGVIFYISKNYLQSESCILEFVHFAGLISKSCLFVLLDDAFGEDGAGVMAAFERFGLGPEDTVGTDLALLLNPVLPYEADISEKMQATRCFAEPELLQYTYLHGMGGIASKLFDLVVGRAAMVSGIEDKNVKRVEIPETVSNGGKTYKVIGIKSDTFRNCEMLEEVTVGNKWLMMEKHIFVRCPHLKRVRLGKPMRRLGTRIGLLNQIFDRCPEARLELADPRVIYQSTFKNSPDITEAVHRQEVSWAGECFAGCHQLRRAVLGKRDEWGSGMFTGCTSLEEVEIPDGNRTLMVANSFSGCKRLKSIRLSRWVSRIGQDSFKDCESLVEINIPRRVNYIHPTAFAGCTALRTVVVDSKNFDYMKSTPIHRKSCFDELFPALSRIYFRAVPKHIELFRAPFEEIPSDRRGYRLFERRENHD